jgi:potassium/hydrogen antiporter
MYTLRAFGPSLVYILLIVGGALVTNIPSVLTLFQVGSSAFLLALTLLVLIAGGLSRYSPTLLHPFVWALLCGMALQHPFAILMRDTDTFRMSIELLAAFTLFAAGLAVPVKNFQKYFAPIAALSLVGTCLSVVLFAYALSLLTGYFTMGVPALSLIALAAILASIDPTAIQLSIEHLRFARPFLRDIALSEGALNDVVGVVLSRFFIVGSLSMGSALAATSVTSGLAHMTSRALLEPLALEIVWGWLVGLLGYYILKTWGAAVRTIHWSDPALFAIIPLFCFALGSLTGGGAGYLAAFIAGLLFETHATTHEVQAFFDRIVGTFVKPIIFILLGAITPLETMAYLLPLGVAAALVFMLIIRPLVVYISLLPWIRAHTGTVTWREVLFLSFLRETGAISAILLLIAVTLGLAASEIVLVVGVWVILLTLIIEPPLTPLVAQRLGVAQTSD